MCLIETKQIPKKLPEFFYKVVTQNEFGDIETIRGERDWKGVPLSINELVEDKGRIGFHSFLYFEDAMKWLDAPLLGDKYSVRKAIKESAKKDIAIFKIKVEGIKSYGNEVKTMNNGKELKFPSIITKKIKLIEMVYLEVCSKPVINIEPVVVSQKEEFLLNN